MKKLSAVYMALLVIISYIAVNKGFALAVFIGGIFIIFDLYFLEWIFKKGLVSKSREEKSKVNPLFILIVMVKIVAVVVGVVLLIKYFKLNTIGFLIGVSVLFLALLTDLMFQKNNINEEGEN